MRTRREGNWVVREREGVKKGEIELVVEECN